MIHRNVHYVFNVHSTPAGIIHFLARLHKPFAIPQTPRDFPPRPDALSGPTAQTPRGFRSLSTLLTLRLTCFYKPSTSPSISLCFDGQCLSEYEQKTQQSPALGSSIAPQLEH